MSKDEQYKKQLEQLRSNIIDLLKANFSYVSPDILKTFLTRIKQLKNVYVLENLERRLSTVDTNNVDFETSFNELISKLRDEEKQKDTKRREQLQKQLKERREQLSLELTTRIENRFPSLPKGFLKKNLLQNYYVIENLEERLSELVNQNNNINLEVFIPILINRLRLEEARTYYKMCQSPDVGPLEASKKIIESGYRVMNPNTVSTDSRRYKIYSEESSIIKKLYDSGKITWNSIYSSNNKTSRSLNILEREKLLLDKAKVSLDELESIWNQSNPMVKECDFVIRKAESQKSKYKRPLSLKDLEDERQKIEKTRYFDPRDIKVARKRIITSIVQRQGRPEFRHKLLAAYENRCAITGCDSEHAIEAAHISPYNGPATNHVTNGLPLRADIHTLFDLHLLSIEPSTYEIKISSKLLTTCYRELDGRKLTLPKQGIRPNKEALQKHYDNFLESEAKEQ